MAGNAKWASDNGGSTSYETAAYKDKDGSLGAGPNSYVLINDGANDSIAVDTEACEIKPTWNAAVCKGDVGRLNIGGPGGGGGGFGGARGAGPGRGAATGPGATPGGGGAPFAGGAPGGPAPGGTNLGAQGPPAGGAARGGGAPGGAPGGRGRGAAGPAQPPQPPVVLSRNGKEYTVTGTTVRAGTEIKVTTERPSVALSLTELDKGSWVIFQLPGFTTAASGTQQNSLDALRTASDTSYFKDKDALWVKVVSPGDPGNGAPGGGASLQVSR
jgi:cell migration-inducing and hyaluronan-binding protein